MAVGLSSLTWTLPLSPCIPISLSERKKNARQNSTAFTPTISLCKQLHLCVQKWSQCPRTLRPRKLYQFLLHLCVQKWSQCPRMQHPRKLCQFLPLDQFLCPRQILTRLCKFLPLDQFQCPKAATNSLVHISSVGPVPPAVAADSPRAAESPAPEDVAADSPGAAESPAPEDGNQT